jgi:hypothetical protein
MLLVRLKQLLRPENCGMNRQTLCHDCRFFTPVLEIVERTSAYDLEENLKSLNAQPVQQRWRYAKNLAGYITLGSHVSNSTEP